MRVVAYQAKPKLCLSKESFVDEIDRIVGELKREYSPDLIVFPEALGLWMCMLRSATLLSRIFSVFLPGHSTAAGIALSGVRGKWDDDVSEGVSSVIQFVRPRRNEIISSMRVPSSLLGGLKEYDILKVRSTDEYEPSLIERVSTWLFKNLKLKMIGMKLRSEEQFSAYIEAFSSAAKKHSVVIQAGSIFSIRGNKMFNIAHTFDENGVEVSQQEKIHPIAFEGMIGIEKGTNISTFTVKGVKCGVAICADVNFKDDHVKALADLGCKVICCPSGGIVPNHMWKFNFDRDVASCHLARSQETGTVIFRTYNAGDLIPGILMFQGRSSITAPEEMAEGGLVEMVSEKDFVGESVLVLDV